jgi:hypothetical protein
MSGCVTQRSAGTRRRRPGAHEIEMRLPSIVEARFIITYIVEQLVTRMFLHPISIEEKLVPLKEIMDLALHEVGVAFYTDEFCLAEIDDLLVIVLNDHIEFQIIGAECGDLVFLHTFMRAYERGNPFLKGEPAPLLSLEKPRMMQRFNSDQKPAMA